MEAGTLQSDGTYPEGTLFRKVDDRLLEMAEIVRKFSKDDDAGGKRAEEEGSQL